MTDTPKAGPAHRRWLVAMAKEPRCGAVKSRLARDIGAVAATGFYRHSFANVSARLAQDPRWHTLIAVSPDTAVQSPIWPRVFGLVPQGPGDLGVRMQRVFDRLPPGPAIIIGTDVPEITNSHIARAFAALGSNDAVIGPGEDGGYWLIGVRRSPNVPSVFLNVRLSSPDTLTDTLANLKGRKVAMMDTLGDVDDGRSYRKLGSIGSRVVRSRAPAK